MPSKHLFIADNRTGLITPVLKFLDRKGISYDYIDADDLERYKKYPSIFHRIYGKLNQIVTGEKRHWGRERLIERHLSNNEYDRVIVFVPAMLNGSIIKSIQTASKKSVCMLWDSIKKEPAGGRHIDAFDTVYSFDKEDTKASSKIKYLPNYIPDAAASSTDEDDFEVDVCGYFRISSLEDVRYKGIEEFAQKSGLNGKVYFVSEHIEPSVRKVARIEFEFLQNNIDNDVKKQLIGSSKAILDYVDPRQKGLSPRLGDAYRFSKILVTNNTTMNNEVWFKSNTVIFDEKEEVNVDLSHMHYTHVKNPRSIEAWLNALMT